MGRDYLPRDKGVWLWKVKEVEGGDAVKIADLALTLGCRHVIIKIADGPSSYNLRPPLMADDILPKLIDELWIRDIEPWGWQYVYLADPEGEARKAIERIRKFELAGFVVNAEAQAKGRGAAARLYMTRLREALPEFPIWLSSYRYPDFHQTFPWADFWRECDGTMPQVYWEQAHNPVEQLNESIKRIRAWERKLGMIQRPIVPIGSAYENGGWQASAAEVDKFYGEVVRLGLPAYNWWSLATILKLGLGGTIRGHKPLQGTEPAPEMVPIGVWALEIDEWARVEGYCGPAPEVEA